MRLRAWRTLAEPATETSGGISGAAGQIYFGTHDGTLWSFGFPIEH